MKKMGCRAFVLEDKKMGNTAFGLEDEKDGLQGICAGR